MTKESRNRIKELDILRGIAAIVVVLFHYTTRYNDIFDTRIMNLYDFKYGHYGVQLFFIISGFVIFMTVEKCKNVLEFVKRRFVRLYPTFWICMIFTFIITSFAGIPRFERSILDFIANFTMIPSLLRFNSIDGVYWSLEVELLFYIWMAFALKFKLLKSINWVLYLWLLSGIIIYYFNIPILNVFLISDFGYLFIAGIQFNKIWKCEANNKIKYHLLILFCLLYGFFRSIEEGIAVLICFIVFYLFVYNKLTTIVQNILFQPFVFLGDISYSLYLTHQFIGMIIIYYLSNYTSNYFVLLLTPLIISIFISSLITFSLEKKITTKLKQLIILP